MGQGNPAVGGAAQGRGYAGHHLEGNPGLLEPGDLLPAPAEHEGIAALQPHHPLPLPGQAHQQVVDLVLGQGVAVGSLAHEHPLGVPAHPVH